MRRHTPKRYYDWSPAIAYSVGLIASDGCLQKDGRHIDLTSKDYEQLLNFSKALGRDFYIGTKTNGKGLLGYRIQFSDVTYYDFLLAAGLTPAKSKTLGPLSIPDEFYPDFLRGLFDGDGSCNGYMDPRWRSSFMFYTSFVSASMAFITYLQQANSRLIGVKPVVARNYSRAWSLAYAKADSHKLFEYMYYKGHGPSLARKKYKLMAFVEHDRAGIMTSVTRASGEIW